MVIGAMISFFFAGMAATIFVAELLDFEEERACINKNCDYGYLGYALVFFLAGIAFINL